MNTSDTYTGVLIFLFQSTTSSSSGINLLSTRPPRVLLSFDSAPLYFCQSTCCLLRMERNPRFRLPLKLRLSLRLLRFQHRTNLSPSSKQLSRLVPKPRLPCSRMQLPPRPPPLLDDAIIIVRPLPHLRYSSTQDGCCARQCPPWRILARASSILGAYAALAIRRIGTNSFWLLLFFATWTKPRLLFAKERWHWRNSDLELALPKRCKLSWQSNIFFLTYTGLLGGLWHGFTQPT